MTEQKAVESATVRKVLPESLKFVFPALLLAMAVILLSVALHRGWEWVSGIFAICLIGLAGVALLVAINGSVHSRLHVRTHATLCFLFAIGAGITIGALYLKLPFSSSPFILFAFLLGILGSTFGVYDRLDGKPALAGSDNYETNLQLMAEDSDSRHSLTSISSIG